MKSQFHPDFTDNFFTRVSSREGSLVEKIDVFSTEKYGVK
jgi:hypothetical protein